MAKRCKVFISYSHEDEALSDSKVKVGVGYPRAFLSRLQAAIAAHDDWLTRDEIFFDDDRLAAESAWRPAIEMALNECELLIFLVSPHSVVSEFCMTKELSRAFQRGIHVITVLLRPSQDWYAVKVRNPATGESKPLGEWHSGGLPKEGGNAKPVSAWGQDEEAAWDNVMKYILDFIEATPFRPSEMRTVAPVTAAADKSVAERVPIPTVLPGSAKSALRSALEMHLEQHWVQARLEDVFSDPELIEGIELPPSPESVMKFVTVDKDCGEHLAEVVGCLRYCNRDRDFGEHVRGALVRMILVIAETYLRVAAVQAGYRPGWDEPVWEREILMASLIAAERLGFSLSFRGSKREPENVFEMTPPAWELGNPDEAGLGLMRSEVMRALSRTRLASDAAISEAFLKASVRHSKRQLKADIVVCALAKGDYAQPASRVALRDFLSRYEIETFFRVADKQVVPQWATEVIGDLQYALAEAFPPAKNAGDEQAMTNPTKDAHSGAAVNIQINAPISGVVNVGNHAQVAGRDISIGNPADWGRVTEALQSLHESIAVLADGVPQKKQLLDDLNDVSTAVETGKPSDGDAKLVKRCLEGLKQGAEAVENGGKIIEKLEPVWNGLKAAWPAFLTLIS